MGYTSTSLKKEVAQNFALDGLKTDQDKVPVIFEIDFKGNEGLFKLTKDISAYAEEEVLIQDGFQYLVTENSVQTIDEAGTKLHVIKLRYPPIKPNQST